jgi:hypothetical protein
MMSLSVALQEEFQDALLMITNSSAKVIIIIDVET